MEKTPVSSEKYLLIEKIKNKINSANDIFEIFSIKGLSELKTATEKYFKGEITEKQFASEVLLASSGGKKGLKHEDYLRIKESKINEYLLNFLNKEISEEEFDKACKVSPELQATYNDYKISSQTSEEIYDVLTRINKKNPPYAFIDSYPYPEEKIRP